MEGGGGARVFGVAANRKRTTAAACAVCLGKNVVRDARQGSGLGSVPQKVERDEGLTKRV